MLNQRSSSARITKCNIRDHRNIQNIEINPVNYFAEPIEANYKEEILWRNADTDILLAASDYFTNMILDLDRFMLSILAPFLKSVGQRSGFSICSVILLSLSTSSPDSGDWLATSEFCVFPTKTATSPAVLMAKAIFNIFQ